MEAEDENRGRKMIDFRDAALPARAVREKLDLSPHPEGGHFREIWRDVRADGGRGAATTILFLLAEGEFSRWHRVDAAEIWLWHAGAPLQLGLREAGAGHKSVRLGPDPDAGEVLQAVVPAGAWQEARSSGAWSLVGCVVAPAFDFSGFELAPTGWEPPVR
jgi:predicted cupin superfamily sugar epimerase